MGITWKYKIELKTSSVFKEIEKLRKIIFPGELKKFVLENNAATPSRYNFMLGNDEKVLGAILSFNHDESDGDSVFTALSIIDDKNLIPFGIDPFGNYICYSLKDAEIVFWQHETGAVRSTGASLEQFIASLY